MHILSVLSDASHTMAVLKRSCDTDTQMESHHQTDLQLDPSLMFIELSVHCVKTLELMTAALLSYSSKVCKSNQVILPDNK